MKKIPGGEEGQTLFLVLVITTVLLLLTSVLGPMTLSSYKNVVREEEYIKAHCAADAGIEKTIAAIKGNPGWLENLPDNSGVFTDVFPESPLSDGVSYAVGAIKQRQNIGNSLLISSLGQCKSDAGELLTKKTLRCRAAVYGAKDYLKGLTILSAQPATFEMHDITVDGSMILNGGIDLPDTVLISGDIYAGGKVTGDCGGQIYSYYEYTPSFPELDENYYLHKATECGHVFYGDVEFSDPLLTTGETRGMFYDIANCDGFYYVDGDVDISGSYQGRALIFSTGDIRVVGNLHTGGSGEEGTADTGINGGSLTLVALGDVEIHNFLSMPTL